jgi:hypothetical protein
MQPCRRNFLRMKCAGWPTFNSAHFSPAGRLYFPPRSTYITETNMTSLQKISTPLFLLFAATGAWACYDPAGSGQCGPYGIGPRNPDGYGYNTYIEPAPMYIPPPPPIRESRYGAVAVYANPKDLWDSKTMFASVRGIHSKESARQMAQQTCNRKSGHSCRIEFDYADQCVSVAMGDVTEGLMLFYGLSGQPGQAPLDAMQKCLAAQGKDCEFVVQEECSLPE